MSAGIPFGFGDIAAAIDPRRRQPIPFGNPDVVLPSELPGVEIPTRETDVAPVQAPAPSAGVATSFLGAPDIAWPNAQAPAAPASPREPEATASVDPKPVRLPMITAPAPTSVSPAPVVPSVSAAATPAGTPAPVPAAAEDNGFMAGLRRFSDRGGFDYLGALGAGLLSAPTMAGGVAAGMQLAQRGETQRAASDLAKTELALKKRKLAQEDAAAGGNASLLRRAYPWMTDSQAIAAAGNSALVTDALKLSRDPNAGRQMAEDSSGVRRWVDTGKPIFDGDNGKSYEMVPEAERVQMGLPAGAYQRDGTNKISPVNPTGTTINMGAEKEQDKVVGKGYGDLQLDFATKGRNAASTLNTLSLMEQAARNDNFYSGAGAEWVKRANQGLVALGVKDANYTKPTEVFDALSNKVVLDGLGGSLGPGISNTDRDYIGRTAPTLQRTKEGNLELIGIARTLAQRQQQMAKLARAYAGAHGGRLDAGFDQEVESFAEANPLFPAAKAASTKVSDGATGANGTGGFAAPKTQADFDALPKGAPYIDPSDGKKYRK